MFVRTSAETVIGTENYEAHAAHFSKRLNRKDRNKFSCTIMPRRYGKTVLTANTVAALLMTVPSIVIAVVSPADRQCKMFIQKIKGFLGDEVEYIEDSQKCISILGRDGTVRKVTSYPGGPNSIATVRGMTAHIVFLEELANINQEFMDKVIIPIVSVSNTTVCGITTPLKAHHPWMRRLTQKDCDTKEGLWNLYQETPVCSYCLSLGGDAQRECKHKRDEKPKWKQGNQQRQIKQMLDKDTFMQVNLGFGIFRSTVFKQTTNNVSQNHGRLHIPPAGRPWSHVLGRERVFPARCCRRAGLRHARRRRARFWRLHPHRLHGRGPDGRQKVRNGHRLRLHGPRWLLGGE